MILASEALFEPSPAERAGALYWPYYGDSNLFDSRCRHIIKNYLPESKILIAGCAWGYLVMRLSNLGFDVQGCDASDYALYKGRLVNKMIAGQLLWIDVTDELQVRHIPDAYYDLVVTEDLLPCLSDHEIALALPNLRRIGKKVMHILSFGDPESEQKLHPLINWKLGGAWVEMLLPDMICDFMGKQVA